MVQRPLQRMQALFPWLLLLLAAFPVYSQEKPKVEKPSPAAQATTIKTRDRVWTNDDLASVRKPWDVYLDRKAAADAAGINASTAAAAAEPKSGSPSARPAKALKETDQRIEATTKGIHNRELAIRMLEKRLENSSDQERTELQQQIDDLTSKLENDNRELNALEGHRQELSSQTANVTEGPASTSTGP